MKRQIATICGSGRYRKEIEKLNSKLTMLGIIVLAPGVFLAEGGKPITTEEKEKLDKLHMDKIEMSDVIYFVNGDESDNHPYIGQSTFKELVFAASKRKEIVFTHSFGGPGIWVDGIGMDSVLEMIQFIQEVNEQDPRSNVKEN